MAVRATSVRLYVLHTGRPALTALEQTVNSQYAIEPDDTFIPTTFEEGTLGQAQYDMASGPVMEEGLIGSSTFNLEILQWHQTLLSSSVYDVYVEQELNSYFTGQYAIDVLKAHDGPVASGAYDLHAFIQYDGISSAYYDIEVFAAANQSFDARYNLSVLSMAQGHAQGSYDLSVYRDLLARYTSTYDLKVYELKHLIFGQGDYALNAWQAFNQTAQGLYDLEVFVESTEYKNSQYALDVYRAVEELFISQYDINALQLLVGNMDGQYSIEVLRKAQAAFGSQYDLNIFAAFDAFTTHTYDLGAFTSRTVLPGSQYDLSVFLPLTGSANGSYAISALQALLGSFNGQYLLDATNEFFTWVLNHNTGAPSRYENFGFDAFAKVGGQYLGAKGDGIYLLGGDDDDGVEINAIATTGEMDFGVAELKRVMAAYLGMGSSGQVHLTLKTDQSQVSGPYRLRQATVGRKTERAKFNRGMKARHIQFELENTAGEAQEIDSVDLDVAVVRRKLQR